MIVNLFSDVPGIWLNNIQEVNQEFQTMEQGLETGQPNSSTAANVEQRRFSCPRCNNVYNWRSNLRRHIRLECGKAPQFHCPFCPYKTKQKGHLSRHIAARHRNLNLKTLFGTGF